MPQFDWKSVLGVVAPTVATALGGPLAGLAVEALGAAFGITNATEKDVQQALEKGKLTGDQIVQMKMAEDALKTKMRELDIQENQLYVSDRDSARKREASVQDSTNRNLAYVIVGAFLAMVGATLLGYAKVESVLAGTLVGYLSAKCEQILAYYFGSSRSGDRKTELLAHSVPVVSVVLAVPEAWASVVKVAPAQAALPPQPPPVAPSEVSLQASPTKSPSRPSRSAAYTPPHLAWEPATSAEAIHSSTSEAAPAGKVPNVTSGKRRAASLASASPQTPSQSSAPANTPRPRPPVSPLPSPRNNNHDQALHRSLPPRHSRESPASGIQARGTQRTCRQHPDQRPNPRPNSPNRRGRLHPSLRRTSCPCHQRHLRTRRNFLL